MAQADSSRRALRLRRIGHGITSSSDIDAAYRADRGHRMGGERQCIREQAV